MLRQVAFSLFLLAAGLAACKTETTVPNMPNPASKHCIEQGGTLRIVTATDGSEHGVCTLKNGMGCEEWAYFRGECPTACPQQANQKICPMYAPPPADFCKEGEIFVTKNACDCPSPPQCDMTPGS